MLYVYLFIFFFNYYQSQDSYDELYRKSKSEGTLYNFKNVYDYRAVNGIVKQDVNAHVQFLQWVTRVYVVAAYFYMCDVSTTDERPAVLAQIESKEAIRKELNKVATNIVDMVYRPSDADSILQDLEDVDIDGSSEFCFCKQMEPGLSLVKCDFVGCKNGHWFHTSCVGLEEDDIADDEDDEWFCSDECRLDHRKRERPVMEDEIFDPTSDVDNVREYAKSVIWAGLNDMIRRDATQENDGNRIIRHWKFDLLKFMNTSHPNYTRFAIDLLLSVNGAVCPRVQWQLKWSRTVNTTGTAGGNHSQDLECEHLNKKFKGILSQVYTNLI